MQQSAKNGVSVIAHRGYSGKYPENTLLSFSKAIEIGADYVELDIHRTADGKIIVIHDAWTTRVGDVSLNVETATWEQLQKVNLPMEQKIPLLDDVFALCKGKIGVQVEVKQKGLAKDLFDMIKKHNMQTEVFVSSFKHELLQEMKDYAPEIPTATLEPTSKGWITSIFGQKSFIKNSEKVGSDAIHPFYRTITEKFMKSAKEIDRKVNAWTIDSPQIWEKMIVKGVDGIITNQPEEFIKYLKNRK